ncbi:MAG: tetratricopeptide repeat protein [Myxococcales bacterium]|nr:tetratricopeptide repeat protein [Myxococcales bacterium]
MNQSNYGTRILRAAATLAAVATVGLGTGAVVGSASAADQCISAEAQAAMKDCPAGTLKASSGKKPQVSFKSSPQAVSLKKRDDKLKPENPKDIAAAAQRDERKAKMQKKSRQLLVTELQNLESLFASTKKNSPDRPKLARRLAEGYVELEAAAFRDQTESEIRSADAKRKKDSKTATDEANKAQKAKAVVGTARKSAIKYYSFLKSNYSKWCLQPNTQDPTKSQGCGDEVLYYLAYEYEQAKDLDNARKVYFELVDNWKTSKYRPNAYLAFGELFFQEAQSDPSKWGFAQQSYEEVTKYPPPDNKLYGYALYKLGYVHWNQGDYEKAVDSFKKVIDYGVKFSNLPNSTQLATSARRDIIPVYALWGDPKKAYNFFKPISGDSGGDNDKTFKMMDELGINYLDTGHYDEGIALYTDLMGRDKGAKWCEYHGHIAEATMAKKSGAKDEIVKVLGRQMDVYKEFLGGSSPADAKVKCGNITAGTLAETAMAWHLEAVGSGGVRGTGDKKTMKLAADLYEKVTQNFKQEDFAKFTFPRIVKEDWPDIMKIKYAMADLLYFQQDWERCGPAFDSVVAEDPKGPQAPEAAFAAVLCYQNIYTERHKGGEDKKGTGNMPGADDKKKDPKAKPVNADVFKPKEYSGEQKGMLTAFNRYLCYIQPESGNKEAMDQFVEVKYARARTQFEARHWEEAALGFRDVAINHSDKEVGVFAANLYLEAANILGTRLEPTKSACIDDIAKDTPQFIKLYCEGNRKAQNEEQCSVFFRVQRDVERLSAEATVKECDGGGANAIEKCRAGAQKYLDIWEKYGKEPCEKNQKDACARNEEVLYNAARAFQAARLLAKSIAVRKILINPKYNLHETALAKKAVYEIGGNYQAIAVYDEAAAWYERFAQESPKDEKAPQALSDAIVLRLGLGQEDQAIKDEDLFRKNFSNRAQQAAQIAFAIGAHYTDRGDWANARKRLSGAIGQIDRNATADVKIQAHALLARVYDKLGSKTQARGEYDKVRGFWKDPAAGVKEVEKAGGAEEGEAQKLRRLAKTLEAVGEAYFFFAEEKKAAVDKIAFPEYKGSGERAEVQKFVKEKVADWQKKKRAAIEEADKEYQKILGLQPVAPPRWVIAAGSRVGQMKGKFVAEFRAAPIPKDWKQNGPSPYGDLLWEEIRGAYYSALDEASEPDKQAAKGAYKTCLDLSVKYQYFDDFSRSCEAWLSKTYPAEYHLIDEFRSAPNRLGSGLTERAVPLNMDGTPWAGEQPKAPEKPADKPAPAADKPAAAADKPGAAPAKAAAPAAPAGGSKEDDALSKAKKK